MKSGWVYFMTNWAFGSFYVGVTNRVIAYGRHCPFFRHRRNKSGDDDGRDRPSEPFLCDWPGVRADADST